MTLSVLQLNINSDNYWSELVAYLTSHDFDVIQLQEVTGKDTLSGNINSKIDVFAELQKILGDNYYGELAISERFTSSPSSYIGNATFYKKEFSLVEKNIVTLHKSEAPFSSEATSFEDEGRTLLHLKLAIDGKTISLLNTHFAWAHTSQEKPHQTKQGELLLEYLQTVESPFIFTGDMNLDPEQPTIQKLNTLARNLTTEHHITNTLNPRTHRVKELFPKGIAVDYIFVSNTIEVKNFGVIEEDLSDHLGLEATLVIPSKAEESHTTKLL